MWRGVDDSSVALKIPDGKNKKQIEQTYMTTNMKDFVKDKQNNITATMMGRMLLILLTLLTVGVGEMRAADYVFFSNGHFLGVSGGAIAAPTTFDKESCIWTTTATAGGSGTFSVKVSGTTYYLTSSIGVSTFSGDAATFYLSGDGHQVSTASDANYLQYNSSVWDAEGSGADNGYELKDIVKFQWAKNGFYFLTYGGKYNNNNDTPYLITGNWSPISEWALLKYDDTNSFMLNVQTSKFAICHLDHPENDNQGDAFHLATVTSLDDNKAKFKISNEKGTWALVPYGSEYGLNSFGGAGKNIGLYDTGSTDDGSKWYMVDSDMEKPTITISTNGTVTMTTSIANGKIYYNANESYTAKYPTLLVDKTEYKSPFSGTANRYIKAFVYDPATDHCSGIT